MKNLIMKFGQWYKRGNNKFWFWGILITLYIIGSLMDTNDVPTTDTQSATASHADKKVNQFDAYGISAQIAKGKYDDATPHFIEGIDMGDGDWMIRGYSKTDNRKI